MYANSGANGIFRKLLDEWGVQLWVDGNPPIFLSIGMCPLAKYLPEITDW